MFDNIKCELPLPGLPQGILDRWVVDGEEINTSEVIFQTKDTPNQYMSLYKIDSEGQLYEEKVEGYWEEDAKDAKDDTEEKSFLHSLSLRGKYHETSCEWVKVSFNGSVNFYEAYNHPEKPKYGDLLKEDADKDWMRYVYGWVEYQAQFINGKIQGDIILIKHDLPIRYTDEELAAKKEKWSAERAELAERFKENRKNYPSPEQKLIDSIYEYVSEPSSNVNEDIMNKIKEYREKYDTYHE